MQSIFQNYFTEIKRQFSFNNEYLSFKQNSNKTEKNYSFPIEANFYLVIFVFVSLIFKYN
jgi:hypothetical protein